MFYKQLRNLHRNRNRKTTSPRWRAGAYRSPDPYPDSQPLGGVAGRPQLGAESPVAEAQALRNTWAWQLTYVSAEQLAGRNVSADLFSIDRIYPRGETGGAPTSII